MSRNRTLLLLSLVLALAAGAVWLVLRGGGEDAGDPVERLVADMVPIPGRDYLMGKYEVTQAQWEAVMGGNQSFYKGADHPVEMVSWNDCQAFLAKLNAHPAAVSSGLVFRLPTEEEWKYACRAGATGGFCRLADGTEITEATLGRVAWYYENASTRPRWLNWLLNIAEDIVDRVREVDWYETSTHRPVGRKEPNAFGLCDMHGNVWEWTDTAIDEWEDTVFDPLTDMVVNERRILRGGNWTDFAWACRCGLSGRYSTSPDRRDSGVGFRLCASGRADPAP